MKAKQTMVMAVLVASTLALGGESLARGGGADAGNGRRQGVQSMTQSTNRVRPEGSQRRDGTFLNTGTRANGSTTRPSNGRGLMDGTGICDPIMTDPMVADPIITIP